VHARRWSRSEWDERLTFFYPPLTVKTKQALSNSLQPVRRGANTPRRLSVASEGAFEVLVVSLHDPETAMEPDHPENINRFDHHLTNRDNSAFPRRKSWTLKGAGKTSLHLQHSVFVPVKTLRVLECSRRLGNIGNVR
jgi:hypothetical protein